MKNNKGEIAFTTIVQIVIVAVVLIAVIVWFLPAFSGTAGETDNIKEGAGVTDDAVLKVKCKRLCGEAQELDELNQPNSEFCEPECKGLLDGNKIVCENINCEV
jgi:hypothetical protein